MVGDSERAAGKSKKWEDLWKPNCELSATRICKLRFFDVRDVLATPQKALQVPSRMCGDQQFPDTLFLGWPFCITESNVIIKIDRVADNLENGAFIIQN